MRQNLLKGKTIHATGMVQGVGFRPFIHRLALHHNLVGWVQNTSDGVHIHVEGLEDSIQDFIIALREQAPPLARIDSLALEDCAPLYLEGFEIRESSARERAFQPVPPDVALCADCRRELFDLRDRRYRYAFINCTNCGPRFTIIRDIPYDRPMTTMADFALCETCAAEYHDSANRRFHAQPVACAQCGPRLWLQRGDRRCDGDEALRYAAELLRVGHIVAIKGLGGFHLACNAAHAPTVAALRQRKARPAKPFALMLADLDQVRRYCRLSNDEAALLTSPASPIVLLERRVDGPPLADEVAPRQKHLGVMLPYTPLHALLLAEPDMPPLVMTSGNAADEPIVTDNDEARQRLAHLADAFLFHDRPIHISTDDSVVRLSQGQELPIRRSRGYAPCPVLLPFDLPPLLAVGAELKNTFCVARQRYAIMSQHIGDMEDYATQQLFAKSVAHFERLFRVQPQAIAHDLHPDYAATRYAQSRAQAEGLPLIGVQHHHAHVAACMAEHGLHGDRPIIGVCFDGTGYGTDGTIWGGEFLLADYRRFERLAHLAPMPLPGGDASTRRTARLALAYLWASGLGQLIDEDLPALQHVGEAEWTIIQQQMVRRLNTPLTSSMGRLFDAVSALLGVCLHASYEGQAAIELEALVDPHETGFYDCFGADGLDMPILFSLLLADKRAGLSVGRIAARFHHTIACWVAATCQRLGEQHSVHEVALSGGTFQNVALLGQIVKRLEALGFMVYSHRLVPPNDGGLALGQMLIAYSQLIYSEKDP
ncbi:MAG: carbamoyltransferase HypF [Anaerolineae bacterium]|nr:carbamoyltransferase HypF [Anaerolineae bacterium]MDW8171977.1 carbamoyltransferase HypF [Anaerolineae bacterium]